jgi:uncharacterized protein (DUF1330 family)
LQLFRYFGTFTANRSSIVDVQTHAQKQTPPASVSTEPEEQSVKVENSVSPKPEQIKEFAAVEGAVMMVNLLKYRDKAVYEDGRETDLSGRDAYALYAKEMVKLVEASGGRFVFGSEVTSLLLGEVEELWDQVGIVEYPSSKDLLAIASSPEFQAIEVHRVAGLAGQLNITTREGGL